MAEVRAPEVAGRFYPENPKELQEMVDQFLTQADQELAGEPVALLAPHAGYVFSGGVEGYSYRPMQKYSFSSVIVIGTAHYYPVEGAAVYTGEGFQTPLGSLSVDQELANQLVSSSRYIQSNTQAHQREHSVETQVPFLQRSLGPSVKIVPVVMGNPDYEICQAVGEAVVRVIQNAQAQGKKVLLVVSSDLSHYPSDEDARRVDHATLEALQTLDAKHFVQVSDQWMHKGISELDCTYCGQGAVTAVMIAAKKLGATRAQILRYATSADVPYGEKERVVGYAAVAFIKESEFSVSKEDQAILLKLARSTLERALESGERPRSFEFPKERTELTKPAAVFVTLRKQGVLRGCIGGTEFRFPLGEAVQYFSLASAFEDPRFPPLQKEELAWIKIEVSVLSPLKRVPSAEEISPSVHGVTLRRGARSGLFLPQVWQETGWTKEEFLNQLALQKAGLSPGSWQDPETELYVFTVFAFEEE